MAIPNLLYLVESLSKQYPFEWSVAHTSHPQTEDFIKILAWEASKVDPKFGLNGKRGDYNDISDDVLNYFGEGPGHDPATGSPVTVIDVIAGAGGPNPTPSWQPFSDLPGPGGWIKASEPGTSPTPPPSDMIPPYESLGGDAFFRAEVGVPLESDTILSGGTLNNGSAVWFSRSCYDLIVAKSKDPNADPKPIMTKHRNDWRALMPPPPGGWPQF